jgi:hypothetical protein
VQIAAGRLANRGDVLLAGATPHGRKFGEENHEQEKR